MLDGDNLRQGLNSDLSFSKIYQSENIYRASEVTKLFLDAGIITLAAFISPSHLDRKKVNKLIVYIKKSLLFTNNRDSN